MATYKIDPSHSEIVFKVRHLVITTVSGHFSKFDATMTSDKEDFSDAQINFEADVNTITTNNEQRDGHLKGADFFDVANYPAITFKSTSIEKKDDNEYTVTGDLTMHGVTKSITLDVVYNGTDVFYGTSKYGFDITGKINRKDFGLIWNAATETGGIVLSEEVKLALNVQMAKEV